MTNKKKLFIVLAVLMLAGGIVAGRFSTNITNLDVATSTGAGTGENLGNGFAIHTWEVVVTGGPSTVSVTLQGSLNNSTWYTLDTSTTTTSEMRHVVNKKVRFVRANVATLTGGTSPTITVRILSGGNN